MPKGKVTYWCTSTHHAGACSPGTRRTWIRKVSLGLEPPKGRYWTLHCVRAGAASAANALKIPIPKIRACGGWGRRSQVPEDRYIDHMCRACDDARRFFGWLAD